MGAGEHPFFAQSWNPSTGDTDRGCSLPIERSPEKIANEAAVTLICYNATIADAPAITASFRVQLHCDQGTAKGRIMRRIWLAVALLVAWNSTARAGFPTGLIDVDFNFDIGATQSGAAVIGASGDVWNGQSNPFLNTIGVLNLATGIPSNGVAYSLSGVTNAGIIGGTSLGATQYGALMSDGYTVGPGKTMTIGFSGLTAFQPYDLYFYSSFANPSGNDTRTTTFTIASNSLTAMNVGIPMFSSKEITLCISARNQRMLQGRLLLQFKGSVALKAVAS